MESRQHHERDSNKGACDLKVHLYNHGAHKGETRSYTDHVDDPLLVDEDGWAGAEAKEGRNAASANCIEQRKIVTGRKKKEVDPLG